MRSQPCPRQRVFAEMALQVNQLLAPDVAEIRNFVRSQGERTCLEFGEIIESRAEMTGNPLGIRARTVRPISDPIRRLIVLKVSLVH